MTDSPSLRSYLVLTAFAAALAGCSDNEGATQPGPSTGGIPPATGGVGPTGGLGTGGEGTGGEGTGGEGTGGEVGTGGVTVTPIQPTVAGTVFTLVVGDTTFSADANSGGKVMVLAPPAGNLLTGPEISSTNFGSTFWPSPQTWSWPPPAPIDSDPYVGQIDGSEIVLSGSADPATGISVEKRYSAMSDGWISLTYTMTNTSSTVQQWAPWEVTRVHKAGYTVFPAGPAGVLATSDLAGVQAGTEIWFDAASGGNSQKLFADGAGGWMAHATGSSLFVKRFPDLDQNLAAGGEAEIEIYAASQYIELEIQGIVATMNPGDSSSWTVEWKVEPLSAPVPTPFAAVDTASLLALAQQVAAE